MNEGSRAGYTRTAVVLHWLIAVAVLAQIALGWWMQTVPKSPPGVRAGWYNFHKSIGLTLAALVVVRILWRLAHAPPALPFSLPRWQRIAARWSHAALYVCLVAMPLTGYLGSSFTKYPVKYFGHTLPHWGWDSPVLKTLMSDVHYATAIVFMTLIAIHVAAAVKHLATDRSVFMRMWAWPRLSAPRSRGMAPGSSRLAPHAPPRRLH